MNPHSLDIARIKTTLVVTGAIALIAGAAMAFSFGATMSYKHALILALLSIVAAVMPTMIDYLHKQGRKPTAYALTAIAALFIGAEYFSHLGYTIGHRVADTDQTRVQNVRYDDAREQVVDNRKNLDMWKAQLARLESENGWAASVTADALRAKLPALELAIAQEAKRGGCGPVCLQRTRERDQVQEQIATAEARTDLTKRIVATQRLVDTYRERSATTEHRSSPIVNQTKFVAQIWTTNLEPGAEPMTWTQIGIGALIALVTTFLAPVCFFMAFGDAQHQPTTGFVRGMAPSPDSHSAEGNTTMIGILDDRSALAHLARRIAASPTLAARIQ